jgi:hypothetical protein
MPLVSLCVYVCMCSSLLPDRVLFTFGNYELFVLRSCPMSRNIVAPKIGRSQWPRLRPLEHWDRGFESHSRHGCVSVFNLCLCSLCSFVCR